MSQTPRFHRLAVQDLRRESADAVSLTFAIPPALADDYNFTPGQYLTLRTTMDGEEVRRSYSICSGPDDGELRIAVKKVDGGAFSSWAADELKAGDELDVMTPTGRFGIAPAPDAGAGLCRFCRRLRHHAHPVDRQGRARARTPTAGSFCSTATVLPTGMMFREALEELKDRFMQRFSLFHVISGEEQDIPILHGRLDGDKVRVLLRSLVPASSVDHVFICGPTGMSDDIEATCREDRHRRGSHPCRAFCLRPRRQAAPKSAGCSRRAAEGHRCPDHRRQAARSAGRARAKPFSMRRCVPAWTCRSPARAACARPAAPSWSKAKRQWT